MTVTVSVKISARLLECMPKAGSGRNGFIVQALEEKLARQTLPAWRGDALSAPALTLMSDDAREFVTSQIAGVTHP